MEWRRKFSRYQVLNLNLIRDGKGFEGWIKNTPPTRTFNFPADSKSETAAVVLRGAAFFDKSLSLVASLMDLHLYNPEARPTRREVSNENLNVRSAQP